MQSISPGVTVSNQQVRQRDRGTWMNVTQVNCNFSSGFS